MGTTFQGEVNGAGLRLAIVVSRFTEAVTSPPPPPPPLAAARVAPERHDVRGDDIDVAWVPGAFELPLAARKLAETRRYDAVVCLGAVIRGETPHFEYVAGEAARGIADAARDTGVPAIFGVLTTDTLEQALER